MPFEFYHQYLACKVHFGSCKKARYVVLQPLVLVPGKDEEIEEERHWDKTCDCVRQ